MKAHTLIAGALLTTVASPTFGVNLAEPGSKVLPPDCQEIGLHTRVLSSSELKALDEEIAAWVSEGDPVGAEILIIHRGKTLCHKAYGWADRELKVPMTLNSIHRIRSMTKPVVGTAILMLLEDDKLGLDDAVAKYLPSFDNDRSRVITIRDLLTHTSGLTNYAQSGKNLEKPLGQYDSLRGLVDAIGAAGPDHEKGEFFYSDWGSMVLTAIIASVSEIPAEQFIHERILEPLHMKNTFARFSPDAVWAHRMNSTYFVSTKTCRLEKYWDRTRPDSFPFFRGAGGLYSTTEDYARFLASWMHTVTINSKGLLTKETMEMALTPHGSGPGGLRYGMHWTITAPNRFGQIPRAFGHGGSDGTRAIAFPELDTVVLFFTQSRGSSAQERFLQTLKKTGKFADILAKTPNRHATGSACRSE